ncbi:MAG: NosD domain-containing protein [Myxococcota bacterium]
MGSTTEGHTTMGAESTTGSMTTGSTSGDSGDEPIPLPPIDGTIWHVAPEGNDAGAGTAEEPFATLQRGLEAAMPGDGIELADGEYAQGGVSVRAGEPDAKICIYGSDRAVLRGMTDTVLVIAHDHYVVHGLTIDGLHGDPGRVEGYADQLLGVEGPDTSSTVRGVQLLELTLRNAADECVRLRNGAQDSEIAGCTISDCGLRDFVFGDLEFKNGEGIFIGTPEDVWAGSGVPDRCDGNWIHDNEINTRGNECVDVQEGSAGNIIEGNECRGQRDSFSGGISIRGNGNVVRDNTVEGCSGAGVRLGGDPVGNDEYGVDNDVTGNTLVDNAAGGVKIQKIPQGSICGNELESNGLGPSVGDYGDQFDPAAPC